MTERTPQEWEAYYERVRTEIANRGYALHTGIRITKVAEDYCAGEMDMAPQVYNTIGIIHGGALATLADTVSGGAAVSRGRTTVTLNYSLSFLRKAEGGIVRCEARTEKVGRTVSVVRCELTDGLGRLIASGQFTFHMGGPIEVI